MQVFKKATELAVSLKDLKSKNLSVGFVPTMGALHSGHLSLVERSVCENDFTVVSIFVNPAQFNNPDDLKKYPRVPEKDLELLAQVKCDFVFLPEVPEIYPPSYKAPVFHFNGLDRYMEGEFRPGHFQGVAAVVKRFFEIIEPDKAYFGEKDYQQLLIIKNLVENLKLPVQVIAHPIARNDKGLALSSRNQLLSENERDLSSAIYQILNWAKENYSNFTPEELKEEVGILIKNGPLILEYVEISDSENLKPVEDWITAKHARIFIAVFMGKVRLIDNVSLF